MPEPIPNLFIVGAAKCGTTSLHAYLAQHPEIYMSPTKEPHYFCSDFHRSSDRLHGGQRFLPVRTECDYQALFSGYGTQTVVGESSASYLYSKEAAGNIAAFNPQAKIIICLRSPAELLRSWHSYLLFCLEENIEGFEDALAAEPRRRRLAEATEGLPTNLRYPERLYYSAVGMLSEQVTRYKSLFPAEHIHFVLLEEMKSQPAQVYANVLNFLGVSPHTLVDFEVRNARSVRKSRALTFIQREILVPLVESSKPQFLSRLLPSATKRRVYSILERVNVRVDRLNRDDNPVSAPVEGGKAFFDELHAGLRSEAEQLASLIERPDLPGLWGYG